MVDYVKARSRADKMLRKYGRSMTLSKQASSSYDVTTSSNTITAATYTVYGAVFDLDLRTSGGFTDKGSLIEATDKICYISAKGLAVIPEVNDELTVGSDVWTISQIRMQLDPGGIIVLYELGLDK